MWRLTRPLDRTKAERRNPEASNFLLTCLSIALALTVLLIISAILPFERTQRARESFEPKERGDVDRLLPALLD